MLLVDFDPKGNLTDYFLTENPIKNKSFEEVYEPFQVTEYFIEVRSGLWLLPASQGLYEFELSRHYSLDLPRSWDAEKYFPRLFQRLNFDYILVDTLPTFGLLTLNAIDFTKYVVVPVSMTHWALQSLVELDAKIFNMTRNGQIYRIIPTFFERVTTVSREIYNRLCQLFATAVTKTVIPRRVQLEKLANVKATVFDVDGEGDVAQLFMNLAREFMIQ